MRRPPRYTLTDTLCPYTPIFRSHAAEATDQPASAARQKHDLHRATQLPRAGAARWALAGVVGTGKRRPDATARVVMRSCRPGDKPYDIRTSLSPHPDRPPGHASVSEREPGSKIGRASWRDSVCQYGEISVGAGTS